MHRHPRYSYLNLEPFDAQPNIPQLPQFNPPQLPQSPQFNPPQPPQLPEFNPSPSNELVPGNSKVPPVDSPEFLTNLDALVAELGIPQGESSPDSEEVLDEVPDDEPAPRKRRRQSNLNLTKAQAANLPAEEESLAGFDRHSRKCKICQSPKREEIEQAFLEWESPDIIRSDFRIRDRHTIYRHARAMGLMQIRGRNLRAALAHILEHASYCRPTGESVIRAARAYASLTGYVRWVDPPTTHIVVPGRPASFPPALAGRAILAKPVKSPKRARSRSGTRRLKRGRAGRKA